MSVAEMKYDSESNEEIKISNKSLWYKVTGQIYFYPIDESRPLYYLAC
jgi:hypothetical protein